jgi:hypothetical protein
MLVDLDVAMPPPMKPALPVRSFRVCGSVPVDTTGSVRPPLVADTPRGGLSATTSLSGRAALLAAAAPSQNVGDTFGSGGVVNVAGTRRTSAAPASAMKRAVNSGVGTALSGGNGGAAEEAADAAARLRAFYTVNAGDDGAAALERQLRLREVLAAEAQMQEGLRVRNAQAENFSRRWDNLKDARLHAH